VRIAALYDIHGNLPALNAVLAELGQGPPDLVVVGGDVAAGPMPAEVLDRLSAIPAPVRYVRGNADREVVAAFDGTAPPKNDDAGRAARYAAARITRGQRDAMAAYEPVVRADGILFCHGSPRSDEEIITELTPPERLDPMLERVRELLVVCGHTHHQFHLGRVVNAGSVGLPYEGRAAAFWLLLEDGVPHHRATEYDIDAAVAAMRATSFPDIDEFLRESLVEPVSSEWVARFFEELAGRS
jgi:predicted phosphodiesterase